MKQTSLWCFKITSKRRTRIANLKTIKKKNLVTYPAIRKSLFNIFFFGVGVSGQREYLFSQNKYTFSIVICRSTHIFLSHIIPYYDHLFDKMNVPIDTRLRTMDASISFLSIRNEFYIQINLCDASFSWR